MGQWRGSQIMRTKAETGSKPEIKAVDWRTRLIAGQLPAPPRKVIAMNGIKLRAWDGESKVMYVQSNFVTFHLSGRNLWACWYQLGLPNERNVAACGGEKDVLMQYAGIKDRDWWEDDILQPIDGSDRAGIIAHNDLAEYEGFALLAQHTLTAGRKQAIYTKTQSF